MFLTLLHRGAPLTTAIRSVRFNLSFNAEFVRFNHLSRMCTALCSSALVQIFTNRIFDTLRLLGMQQWGVTCTIELYPAENKKMDCDPGKYFQ